MGSILVQVAKIQGLTVITTANQRNHAWSTTLGANQVIDYRHSDLLRTNICRLSRTGVLLSYWYTCSFYFIRRKTYG